MVQLYEVCSVRTAVVFSDARAVCSGCECAGRLKGARDLCVAFCVGLHDVTCVFCWHATWWLTRDVLVLGRCTRWGLSRRDCLRARVCADAGEERDNSEGMFGGCGRKARPGCWVMDADRTARRCTMRVLGVQRGRHFNGYDLGAVSERCDGLFSTTHYVCLVCACRSLL